MAWKPQELPARIYSILGTPPSLFYLIVDKATDRPVGYAQTYSPSPWDGWLYAAFYLIPDLRGQPHFMETALLTGDALFRWYPLRKIYVEVYEFADFLYKLLLGVGFVQEGFTPDHFWYDGRWWGLWRMALYRERWLECRERITDILHVRAEYAHVRSDGA